MINSSNSICIGEGVTDYINFPFKNDFKKIKNNLSEIKNISKIYKAYNISGDENIVAFCKGGIWGLTIGGIIFTNRALYYMAGVEKRGRILYSELCKYIVVRQFDAEYGDYLSGHGGVFLHNADISLEIAKGTVVAKNVVAEEVFEVLEIIQNELCSKNAKAKAEMDLTANRIFDLYRDKIRNGQVKSEDDMLVRVLQTKRQYRRKATLLIAEGIYRLCNACDYRKYVQEISETDFELGEKLNNSKRLFYESYIEDLSNVDFEIDTKYLQIAIDNIMQDKQNQVIEEMLIIGAYAFIRTKQFYFAEGLISSAEKQFGPVSVLDVINFKLVYGTRCMRRVYEDIVENIDNQEIVSGCKDGLGLSALHYKIILDDKNIDLEDILSGRDWSRDFLYVGNKEAAELYDYSFTALVKERADIRRIIQKTDNDIKPVNDTLERLFEQVESVHNMIRELSDCLNDAEYRLDKLLREDGSFSKICELRHHIEEMSNSYQKASNMNWECNKKIDELNDTLSKALRDKEEFISQKLEHMKRNTDILSKILLKIYQNNDSVYCLKNLYVNLNEELMRVYDCNGCKFLMPDNILLDLPFYTIWVDEFGKIHTENQMPYPNYGKSWFSEEAHNDLKILQKEYRQLVKTYHPDVCKEPYANDIFLKISQEYDCLNG